LEHWDVRKKFPKNIVLLSSRAVYGEGVWEDSKGEQFYAQQRLVKDLENQNWKKFKDRVGEKFLPHNSSSQVPNPVSTYGQVKLLQETMLRNWTILNGVNLTILRLQNVIGTHQYGKNSYSGIINYMIRNLHLNKSIEIYEQGQISRDFINVRDVASFLMEFTNVQADQNVLVDVGSGNETSLLDLGNLLITNFPNSKLEVTHKWRQGDVLKAFTKIGKDNSHKDWAPRVPLVDTILEISDFIELSL
jgi:dTDP-L-rhamnose 4-epimerase